MESHAVKPGKEYRLVLLWGIIFLFFFQLLTEFVEGIYLYGLLGSDIPPEIGLVALFFIPLLLLLACKNLSETVIKLLASVGLIARVVEIALPTRGRMIISGIGLASLLLYLPAVLALPRDKQQRGDFSRQLGMGFSLAIFAHMLFRALHSGSDLSAYGGFRMIAWFLAIAAQDMLWRSPHSEQAGSAVTVPANKFKVLAHSLGLFGVLALVYFAISAPNIATRWAATSNLAVYGVLLASWVGVGWWSLDQKRIAKSGLLVAGLLFVLVLVLAILPHQIVFPLDSDQGYPLSEPAISILQVIPLYLMLALSPVLLLIFLHHLDAILAQQPTTRLLGGSFGLGGGFLLLMILSQIFTTVYDYIPVVGPFFRDKYWLVFLIPGLVAVLPLLLNSNTDTETVAVQPGTRRAWLIAAGVMGLSALAGIIILTTHPSPPVGEATSLRIFTYNIQQGYDDAGERNFDGQIALVQSTNPDIIGLQESDTARIAGGNADVVAYFANRLDMYSYYGPSPVTGTFGIALLSKYPIQNPHTYYLYSLGEQVAVIEADIAVNGKVYKVYVTHLGNSGPIVQMREMLEIIRGQQNVIAMGDFNYRPYEEQYAITTAEYDAAFVTAAESVAPATWGDGETIEERIDHVFVSPGTPVLYAEYFTEPESDHPGLFVEIGLGE